MSKNKDKVELMTERTEKITSNFWGEEIVITERIIEVRREKMEEIASKIFETYKDPITGRISWWDYRELKRVSDCLSSGWRSGRDPNKTKVKDFFTEINRFNSLEKELIGCTIFELMQSSQDLIDDPIYPEPIVQEKKKRFFSIKNKISKFFRSLLHSINNLKTKN